jgi:hypothetical protein
MEYRKSSVSFTYISPWGPNLSVGSTRCSYSCALLWQSVAVCVTHSPTSHNIHNTFLSHPWPYTRTPQLCLRLCRSLFAVVDLERSDVQFNIRWPAKWPWCYCSCPACTNIILIRVIWKSLCELCSYWKWTGLTDERTICSSTWIYAGQWSNC